MRRWLRRLGIALLVLLGLALLVYGLLFVPQLYFRTALFIVERSALNRHRVDWAAVRRDAQSLMRGARNTRDTYPAIRLVLERLGDRHSHLTPPERVRELRAGSNLGLGLTVLWPERQVALVLPDSPAARAGIAVGDRLEAVDDGPVEHVPTVVVLPRDRPVRLSLRRDGRPEPIDATLTPAVVPLNRPAIVRRLASSVGYIEVPGVAGGGGSFDRDAIEAIRAIDTAPLCGWVVDLRRNLGGNMWPMLHALRPILGEGNPLSYRFGKGPLDQAPVYALRRPGPAIAVLTSRLTVSSGELVTIAFRGPATTRTFGEATSGLSTSNMDFPMVDGAMLVVTVSRASDRTGHEYDGPIPADEPVAIDWTRFARDDDPVLDAAMRWLRGQEACSGSASQAVRR